MSFEAKYNGRCYSDDCRYGDGEIREGDDVEYHEGELMHRECAASQRRNEPPLCKECFTYHNGECC